MVSLLQVRTVEFLLLKCETGTDHDGTTFRQVLEKLWQQRVPRAPRILTERQEQFKRGHSVGVTFDRAYPTTLLFCFEVDI